MTLALLLTAATGAWAEDTYTITFKANGNTKTVENVTLPHTFELDPIIRELYPSLSGGSGSPAGTSASGNTNVTAYHNNSKHYATISAPFEGVVTVTGQFFKDFTNYQYTLEINCMENLVAISDDKTEATIKMPTYDVNVNYELVRDMSVQMQAQVGDDPAMQPRYRVQWNDEKQTFEPAEMDMMQVLALFSVNDLIEKTTLAQTSYFVSIYAVDAEGNPTGNAMDFTDFTFAPGRYCVTATGLLGGPYDGTTAPSNIFELYQGYQVVIPAGEYVTYYKDEAVRLEEADKNDIELCTITAVEDGKAVLSDNFDAMKANTPFLLKNTTNEEKTILLIPCNEPNLAVTVAKEFKGTEGPCVFSEELMATGDFYVCNGKEFIKVRGAGTLAANKAFLFVEGNNTPASIPFRRSIDGNGEGTTSIDNLNVNDNLNDNEATWYDLNGRKLNGKPAQKGIYIKNGRKVVVH